MKDKNKKDDTSYDGLEKPKMPSIFKMAANFAKDLTKPANKEEDLKNYGPSYGMALSTAIDKKKAEEKEKDA